MDYSSYVLLFIATLCWVVSFGICIKFGKVIDEIVLNLLITICIFSSAVIVCLFLYIRSS